MIKKFNHYCLKFNLRNRIIIDNDFPQDKLVKIMQPYLVVYFTSLYSMIPNKKHESSLIFKHMMLKFSKFNPLFGRKKYKILFKHTANFKKKIIGKIIEFDDNHIIFNDPNHKIENFLTDHLVYKESFNTLNYYFTNLLIVNNEPPQLQNAEEYEEEAHEPEEEDQEEDDDEEYQEDEEIEDEEIEEDHEEEDHEDIDSIS